VGPQRHKPARFRWSGEMGRDPRGRCQRARKLGVSHRWSAVCYRRNRWYLYCLEVAMACSRKGYTPAFFGDSPWPRRCYPFPSDFAGFFDYCLRVRCKSVFALDQHQTCSYAMNRTGQLSSGISIVCASSAGSPNMMGRYHWWRSCVYIMPCPS
jgi:hypothetical protein